MLCLQKLGMFEFIFPRDPVVNLLRFDSHVDLSSIKHRWVLDRGQSFKGRLVLAVRPKYEFAEGAVAPSRLLRPKGIEQPAPVISHGCIPGQIAAKQIDNKILTQTVGCQRCQ